MKKIVINGFFYTKRVDGLYRFASEILNQLDEIVPKDKYEVVVPKYLKQVPNFQNLKIVKYGNIRNRIWEQVDFYLYIRKNNALNICLCNVVPLLQPDIVCLHDLLYKVNRKYYRNFHGRLAVAWSCLNYWRIARSKCKILTVSEYSRQQIVQEYNVPVDRISIISNSWQHVNGFTRSDEIFKKKKELIKGEYYFSLGSLSEYKNFKWVVEVAKKNPNNVFAIAGGSVNSSKKYIDLNKIKNLLILGYVTDDEVASLMSNCKAFIFPSKFEGFGIPPLEAIALGATAIVSNAACLPEVYENSVHYIDPDDYNVKLDALLSERIEPPEKLLKKYNWKESAIKLFNIMKEAEK